MAQVVFQTLARWIVFNLLDSAMQRLNNWGQAIKQRQREDSEVEGARRSITELTNGRSANWKSCLVLCALLCSYKKSRCFC